MLPRLLCTWALLAQALGEGGVAVCDHDDACEPPPAVGANGLLQSKQRTARVDTEGGHRVNVRKAADGMSAEVEFHHQGKRHAYELEARSVYSVGATVVRWTKDGEKHSGPPPTRTFVSRKHGAQARARLHEDGSISGLFHHQGALLELQPEERALSLIDGKDASGVSHRIQRHNASELFREMRMRSRHKIVDGGMLAADPPPPHGDPPAVANDDSDPLPSGFAREWDANWAGDRWYGGGNCYSGDDNRHEWEIDVLSDYSAFKMYGDQVQSIIEQAFAESNIVWENQLNIELKIGRMILSEEVVDSPAWATDSCPLDDWGYKSGVAGKLEQMWDEGGWPFATATHIFSGCTNLGTAAGAAWEQSICKSGKSTNLGAEAINWHGSTTGLWKLFSHELGHNFGAAHSFEDGRGQTGGIMDYGNGFYDGVAQFNTQYRKDEVCGYISSRLDHCENYGVVTIGTPPDGRGPPGSPGPRGPTGNQGPPGPPR